jgi:GNAT superfamily N-acetyltransferase
MHHTVELIDLNNVEEIRQCFPVIHFLRPHLTEESFVAAVQTQRNEGYQIAAIRLDGQVVAAAGYRLQHFLYSGKILYVDDLITLPEKKKMGLATSLMAWLEQTAREQGCDELHLDSGYQRNDAHRLYLNCGLIMNCHHFAKKLNT